MKRKALMVLVLLTPMLVLALALPSLFPRAPLARISLSAVYAGSVESVPSFLSVLQSRGANVTVVTDPSALDVSRGRAFVFNGSWLRDRAANGHVRSFLSEGLNKSTVFSAVGETSALFDAIKGVRPGLYAEGRNPGYSNPALAAYWVTPDGADHIRIVESGDANVQAEALISWAG